MTRCVITLETNDFCRQRITSSWARRSFGVLKAGRAAKRLISGASSGSMLLLDEDALK